MGRAGFPGQDRPPGSVRMSVSPSADFLIAPVAPSPARRRWWERGRRILRQQSPRVPGFDGAANQSFSHLRVPTPDLLQHLPQAKTAGDRGQAAPSCRHPASGQVPAITTAPCGNRAMGSEKFRRWREWSRSIQRRSAARMAARLAAAGSAPAKASMRRAAGFGGLFQLARIAGPLIAQQFQKT